MEKYFMIKTEGHVLVITIMQCPESNVVCLECDTEEEVYRLIRKMDCEITFAQPFHWRHSGQSVWRGRKADFFSLKNRHKAQRKAKFYINKCRSASCMQSGLKQASA